MAQDHHRNSNLNTGGGRYYKDDSSRRPRKYFGSNHNYSSYSSYSSNPNPFPSSSSPQDTSQQQQQQQQQQGLQNLQNIQVNPFSSRRSESLNSSADTITPTSSTQYSRINDSNNSWYPKRSNSYRSSRPPLSNPGSNSSRRSISGSYRDLPPGQRYDYNGYIDSYQHDGYNNTPNHKKSSFSKSKYNSQFSSYSKANGGSSNSEYRDFPSYRQFYNGNSSSSFSSNGKQSLMDSKTPTLSKSFKNGKPKNEGHELISTNFEEHNNSNNNNDDDDDDDGDDDGDDDDDDDDNNDNDDENENEEENEEENDEKEKHEEEKEKVKNEVGNQNDNEVSDTYDADQTENENTPQNNEVINTSITNNLKLVNSDVGESVNFNKTLDTPLDSKDELKHETNEEIDTKLYNNSENIDAIKNLDEYNSSNQPIPPSNDSTKDRVDHSNIDNVSTDKSDYKDIDMSESKTEETVTTEDENLSEDEHISTEGCIFPMLKHQYRAWELKHMSKKRRRRNLKYLNKARLQDISQYDFLQKSLLIFKQADAFVLFNALKENTSLIEAKKSMLTDQYVYAKDLWKHDTAFYDKQLDKSYERQNDATKKPKEEVSIQPVKPTSSRRSRHHGDSVRTEAEFMEILATLEQERERDPLVRAQYGAAIISDMIMDPIEKYAMNRKMDSNNLIRDTSAWASRILSDPIDNFTEAEHAKFCDLYILHPKKFGRISHEMGGLRTPEECVLHYYRTKKDTNYKQLIANKNKKSKKKVLKKKKDSKSRAETTTPDTSAIENDISHTNLNTTNVQNDSNTHVEHTELEKESNKDLVSVKESESIKEPELIKGSESKIEIESIEAKSIKDMESKDSEPINKFISIEGKRKNEDDLSYLPNKQRKISESNHIVVSANDESVNNHKKEPLVKLEDISKYNSNTLTTPNHIDNVTTAVAEQNDDDHENQSSDENSKRSKKTKKDDKSHISSYWSVQDITNFPILLEKFGSRWDDIADELGTKSATMVKNYYQRGLVDHPNWQTYISAARSQIPFQPVEVIPANNFQQEQKLSEEQEQQQKHYNQYNNSHPPHFAPQKYDGQQKQQLSLQNPSQQLQQQIPQKLQTQPQQQLQYEHEQKNQHLQQQQQNAPSMGYFYKPATSYATSYPRVQQIVPINQQHPVHIPANDLNHLQQVPHFNHIAESAPIYTAYPPDSNVHLQPPQISSHVVPSQGPMPIANVRTDLMNIPSLRNATNNPSMQLPQQSSVGLHLPPLNAAYNPIQKMPLQMQPQPQMPAQIPQPFNRGPSIMNLLNDDNDNDSHPPSFKPNINNIMNYPIQNDHRNQPHNTGSIFQQPQVQQIQAKDSLPNQIQPHQQQQQQQHHHQEQGFIGGTSALDALARIAFERK